MFTFDDVAALTALRDSFSPGSVDYQMGDSLVQKPSMTGPVQQGQLSDLIVQKDPASTEAKNASVVLAYWESLN